MSDKKDDVAKGPTEQIAERNFRDALAASLTKSERLRRRAPYWCLAILCIGFLIPLLMLVGVELRTADEIRTFYSKGIGPLDRANLSQLADIWLYLIAVFDWPFLVYAFLAWRWIRKAGQEGLVSALPVRHGLIGLSVPYVFIYGFLVPADLSSGAPGAGQGIGLLGPIVGPVFGFIGAWVGWRIGLEKSQRVRR